MSLYESLVKLIKQMEIGYFGVADLAIALKVVADQGGSIIAEYPYAISLGIPLLNDIVDKLPERSDKAVALNYRYHAYDIINQRLDLAASIIGSKIQDAGYRALPIPAAERTDDDRICASFSHKLGARLAGLGWIGKNCLLVTSMHGPRVRWTSILTDTPLESIGTPVDEEKCGQCDECVRVCPASAFTGRNFHTDEPREARYDARKCENYFKSMITEGKLPVCGMCMYVCPYGRRR